MAYKSYSVEKPTKWITLGGKTREGKTNPNTIEGYFLRTETGPDKFNPGQTRTSLILRTATEVVGVNCNKFLARELDRSSELFKQENGRSAIGSMMLIKYEGTRDTGKGLPMKIFSLQFDADATIEVLAPEETGSSDDTDATDDAPDYTDYVSEDIPPARASAPAPALTAAKTASKLKVSELLAKKIAPK